eukprot:CAMPEP_0119392304 /NCGR_PEP_ID=MMETSP1334-20130426/120627_1 /TAXON_ID=127549 /ORGANISM="Calcidiscus leptoporus, Strain RCC1130" /LENGTH=69 /DNA_ID=CAMNT_0007415143 /DNA_START=219 /DNA_END=428 /DNA_ORIENTATION=-
MRGDDVPLVLTLAPLLEKCQPALGLRRCPSEWLEQPAARVKPPLMLTQPILHLCAMQPGSLLREPVNGS